MFKKQLFKLRTEESIASCWNNLSANINFNNAAQ